MAFSSQEILREFIHSTAGTGLGGSTLGSHVASRIRLKPDGATQDSDGCGGGWHTERSPSLSELDGDYSDDE